MLGDLDNITITVGSLNSVERVKYVLESVEPVEGDPTAVSFGYGRRDYPSRPIVSIKVDSAPGTMTRKGAELLKRVQALGTTGKPLYTFTDEPVNWREYTFDELATQLAAANAELSRRYGPRIFRRSFRSMTAGAVNVGGALRYLGAATQAAVAAAAEFERALSWDTFDYGRDVGEGTAAGIRPISLTPWWLPSLLCLILWRLVEYWPARWLPALEEDKEE